MFRQIRVFETASRKALFNCRGAASVRPGAPLAPHVRLGQAHPTVPPAPSGAAGIARSTTIALSAHPPQTQVPLKPLKPRGNISRHRDLCTARPYTCTGPSLPRGKPPIAALTRAPAFTAAMRTAHLAMVRRRRRNSCRRRDHARRAPRCAHGPSLPRGKPPVLLCCARRRARSGAYGAPFFFSSP